MRLLASLFVLLALASLFAACDTTRDVPPRRAILTAVQIDDGPLVTAAGGGWDGSSGGGPEIYFRLFFADTDWRNRPNDDLLNPRDDPFAVATASASAWYENVVGASFPLVWAVDGGFELNLRDAYRVTLFDYDPTTSDDAMASAEPFVLSDYAPEFVTGREQTIVLRGEGADRDVVQVRLRLVFED